MTLGKLNRAISIKDSDTPQSEPGNPTPSNDRTAAGWAAVLSRRCGNE